MAMQPYTPEIGQAVYGQPWQERECPDWVVTALQVIRDALIEWHGTDPFGNSGERFENDVFKAHAYAWGDDEQPWNFTWGDVEISWYKYLGRGTTINREIDRATGYRMLAECLASLTGEHIEAGAE